MSDKPLQDDVFLASEGNAWHRRNREALMRFESLADIPMRLIHEARLLPRRVLEIGSGMGARLEALRLRYGCECDALEPSDQARASGMEHFPAVRFWPGVCSALPPFEELHDLVIVNFVLHWVDRRSLLHSLAEIDRVVPDRGHLVLGDFAPDMPCAVPYHHRPGIWTYKADYAGMLMATGIYVSVSMLTWHHVLGQGPDIPSRDRCATWLLQKRLPEGGTQ